MICKKWAIESELTLGLGGGNVAEVYLGPIVDCADNHNILLGFFILCYSSNSNFKSQISFLGVALL